ncbi:MAG TPA: sigma 54-interacting transcriptional regulator, partial [Longimicrobiaceae bacterium]
MPAPRIWYRAFGSHADDPVRALAAHAGGLAPLDRDEAPGPGVVFFDELTEPLCDFVRDASRNGVRRVLAVATSAAALPREGAWRLLRHGASDVFAWDHSPTPAAEVVLRLERWRAVDRLVESPLVRNNLVGESPAWRALLRQVTEVGAFTDASVLVTGESGTGKELVAKLIHSL